MRTIITIGREYGSGGKQIGKKLGQALGIPVYDKSIIGLTAKQSGFAEHIIEKAEHQKTGSLLYGLYMSSQALPFTDQIYIAQTKVIRDLSGQGPCVIVGRCADYVLRDHPHCLRVFIHAPVKARIKRAVEEYGVQEKNIEDYVRKEDKKRAAYYNYFTQNKWGLAQNYQLSIDSGIGIGLTVRIIEEAARGGI